jgi:transcriptional regulator with XRE-family HTH domain
LALKSVHSSEKEGSQVNRLREAREARLLSRSELAQKANLSIATINKIEQGKNGRPTLTTMRKILNALGIPPEKRELVFP